MGILTSSFQSSVPTPLVAVLHAPGNKGKYGEITSMPVQACAENTNALNFLAAKV